MSYSKIILILIFIPTFAWARPTYVYKKADGSISFSNSPPPRGISAKVFTAKNSKFSHYKSYNDKISKKSSYLFRTKFSDIISKASSEHSVSEPLLRALIHTESAFNPKAVSSKGAKGLMQLMDFNARKFGAKNPFSPMQNVKAGTKLLAQLLRKYSGDKSLALAAYNAGEQAVSKYNGIPPYKETKNYVKRVLSLEKKYSMNG